MKKIIYAYLFSMVVFTPCLLSSQTLIIGDDKPNIKTIYNNTLTHSDSYAWLEYLCTKIGHRISGSPEAGRAVEYTKSILDTLGLDSVWLQPVMVPKWVRGTQETVEVVRSIKYGTFKLNSLALGGSIAVTEGIVGEVVEVHSFEALDSLGKVGIEGKIVFFNRPMDPTKIRTFEAYSGAVNQRVWGASKASRFGAKGVIVRSMGLRADDFAHTGAMIYEEGVTPIPACAISTNDANRVSLLLHKEGKVELHIRTHSYFSEEVLSYNVIGEIRGTDFPNEIILVGGHLDSWDVGQGAHDDGAGCVQSMQALALLRKLNYRPRRTIRCVLFMNEENGGRGGIEYARESESKKEKHILAIESDAGGFSPNGFTFDGDVSVIDSFFTKVKAYEPLFTPYGLVLERGGSGSDIVPLRNQQGLLCGLNPDSQRYFDYHHTKADVIEAVNKRELELGAAAITALMYLVDQHF